MVGVLGNSADFTQVLLSFCKLQNYTMFSLRTRYFSKRDTGIAANLAAARCFLLLFFAYAWMLAFRSVTACDCLMVIW